MCVYVVYLVAYLVNGCLVNPINIYCKVVCVSFKTLIFLKLCCLSAHKPSTHEHLYPVDSIATEVHALPPTVRTNLI